MRWLGGLLAVALVGAAGGYVAGHLSRDEPAVYASGSPVPAHSPSLPIDPEQPFAPDLDYPALQPDLTYRRHLIGDRPFQWEYDVPTGWTPEPVDLGEVRWRPADEPFVGGFSLRAKLVNEHKTLQQMVDQKLAALRASVADVVVLSRTGDSLSFSYRALPSNHERFNTFRWFTAPGGTEADFEMSVVGRSVDRDGLDDLLDHVAASIEPVDA